LNRNIMRPTALMALPVLFSLAFAQATQPPAQRKDSATVSAGISKEQLALEAQLNSVLSDAKEALRVGRTADAVKQYEAALAMVHKEPLLAEQEKRVLKEAGNGYIQASRPNDAIATFEKLVATLDKDCDSLLETCANALQDLGFAKMHARDFTGGLESLRKAETTYEKAEKSGELHEYSMIQVMNQAKTKLLMAVALFQLGKASDAVKTTEDAIPQLKRVKDDDGINVGIRDSAMISLKDAQNILQRFKSAQ
jgi:tetratricopeptide (TPR) repeat protein